MKKKITIILLLLLLLIFILTFFQKKITYEFSYNDKNYIIKIPKNSYSFENKNFNISFKSFISFDDLEKFKSKFLNSLLKQECNNKTYYYDKNQDITIYNYNIDKNLISKSVQFDYFIGNYCNEKELENVENELQELNFIIEVKSCNNCNKKKLYSTDSYTIYSYCVDDVVVEIENEKMTLENALVNNYITINDIVKKEEIDSKFAETIKTIYENGISYTNYNYSLVVCDSEYIITLNTKYKNLCK